MVSGCLRRGGVIPDTVRGVIRRVDVVAVHLEGGKCILLNESPEAKLIQEGYDVRLVFWGVEKGKVKVIIKEEEGRVFEGEIFNEQITD